MSKGTTQQSDQSSEDVSGVGDNSTLRAMLEGMSLGGSGSQLYQSEEGLTSREPSSYRGMRDYRREQQAHRGQYDFSQLPKGAAGTEEALKKLLGRDVTPTEVANARAYLDTLAYTEGTSTFGYQKNGGQGYDVQVGDHIISDLSHHPGEVVHVAPGLDSSAFGRYQFLERTWQECQRDLKLPDMSPASQDAAALYLVKRNGGLDALVAGDLDTAVERTRRTWASLPGAGYGQHEHRMDTVRAVYAHAGGVGVGQTVGQSTAVAGANTQSSAGEKFDLTIGDSLAGAAVLAGVPGTTGPSPDSTGVTAATSRTPQDVLDFIKSAQARDPNCFKGRNVLLSSGASNNYSKEQMALVSQQIALLQKAGARVTLLGVGPRQDYVNNNVNGQLLAIATNSGIAFGGEIQGTGPDQVHPGTSEAQHAMVEHAQEVKPVRTADAGPKTAHSTPRSKLALEMSNTDPSPGTKAPATAPASRTPSAPTMARPSAA